VEIPWGFKILRVETPLLAHWPPKGMEWKNKLSPPITPPFKSLKNLLQISLFWEKLVGRVVSKSEFFGRKWGSSSWKIIKEWFFNLNNSSPLCEKIPFLPP